MCTYVAKLTHENVGVEDIVQECMIGLWDSSLQFPNVKSLAGWLYKAVYNRALNMIRDRDNARRLLGNYTSEISIPKKWLSIWPLKKVDRKTPFGPFRIVRSTETSYEFKPRGLESPGDRTATGSFRKYGENAKKRAYAIVRERMGMVWGILLYSFFSDFFKY